MALVWVFLDKESVQLYTFNADKLKTCCVFCFAITLYPILLWTLNSVRRCSNVCLCVCIAIVLIVCIQMKCRVSQQFIRIDGLSSLSFLFLHLMKINNLCQKLSSTVKVTKRMALNRSSLRWLVWDLVGECFIIIVCADYAAVTIIYFFLFSCVSCFNRVYYYYYYHYYYSLKQGDSHNHTHTQK